jgi:hypothetical protein
MLKHLCGKIQIADESNRELNKWSKIEKIKYQSKLQRFTPV